MEGLKTQNCLLCGEPLRYGKVPEEVVCHFCGMRGDSPIRCPEGHYICDLCHGAGSLELLRSLAERVRKETPEEIVEEFLRIPALPMHGPEHHPMVGLALLVAAARRGTPLPEGGAAEAIRRGMQIPGGACGYLGGCGAGISLGVALSLLTGATPVRGAQRALANRASAAGLAVCGDGEPRCCKRMVRKAVREGRDFLARELGVAFAPPPPDPVCRDPERNRECPGAACPYFP